MSTETLDGNVVPFPRSSPIERENRAAAVRNRDIRRLRELERDDPARGKKGPVFNLDDRVAAALANGEHSVRARKKGVSIGEIDAAFGTRSDRYRLAPGVDLTTREARRKVGRRLMQQVRGYLRLATAIAKLTGEDADDLKLELIKRTRKWASPHTEDPGDERAYHLDLRLREMSRHVIRQAKLDDLFKDLRRTPGKGHCWSPEHRTFDRCTSPCMVPVGHENIAEFGAPFPGVRLAALPAAELPVTVIPAETYNTPSRAERDFRGTLRLFREIRLVIGPAKNHENIAPMFESRPICDVLLEDGSRSRPIYFHSVYTPLEFEDKGCIENDPYPGGQQARVALGSGINEDTWYLDCFLHTTEKVRLIGDVCDSDASDDSSFNLIHWSRGPHDDASEKDESYDKSDYYRWDMVLWLPVDTAHISFLLDRYGRSIYEWEHELEDVQAPLGDRAPPSEYWFPEGTLAFEVERRLSTGGLERALLDDSACIRRALDDRIREWRAGAEAETERQLGAWSARPPEETI